MIAPMPVRGQIARVDRRAVGPIRMLRLGVVIADMLALPVPEPIVVEEQAITPERRPHLVVPGDGRAEDQDRGSRWRPVITCSTAAWRSAMPGAAIVPTRIRPRSDSGMNDGGEITYRIGINAATAAHGIVGPPTDRPDADSPDRNRCQGDHQQSLKRHQPGRLKLLGPGRWPVDHDEVGGQGTVDNGRPANH